ncbi:MAG: hypothetical protein NVS3B20_06410 [Polyangiales bacterium]
MRSLPPLDPTNHPLSSNRLLATLALNAAHTTPRPAPVLASECLRDDIAPLEPFARRTAYAQVGLGAALVILGGFMIAASLFVEAIIAIAAGSISVIAVTTRRPYVVRAWIALTSVLVMGGLGVVSVGPAAHLSGHPFLAAIRFIAPVILAAALLLRSSYRASRTTRVGIAVGVVLFVIASLYVGGEPIWNAGSSFRAQLVASVMVLLAVFSLLGFMGQETTGLCTVWGIAVMLIGGLALVFDSITQAHVTLSGVMGSAVFSINVAIASIALYQIGARFIGPRARAKEAARASIPPPPPRMHESPDSQASAND